jgi:oxygen-independent coproporphyrinogen-3 oxidase
MYPLENQDQELNWLMYSHALKRLSKAGIRQYEVSNFSRPGFESSHNLCYWSGTDFLGLGPGASSFARPLRWTFKGGVKEFITYFGSDNPDNPCMAARALSPEIYDIENISPIDQMSEFMFMGLRKKTGIQDIEFENLFNSSFYTIYGDTIKKLVSHDLLWSGNSAVGLTEKGFMLGNRVFMEFLDEKG